RGLLDRLDDLANSAVELRNRRVDGVAPAVGCPFRRLPMEGHGVRYVEGDDLRHDFGPLGELGGREAVRACERVERPAQASVPSRTANARVEADLGLRLDSAPARLGITSIEIAEFRIRELNRPAASGESRSGQPLNVGREWLLECEPTCTRRENGRPKPPV